eukprot:CAMPEP_0185757986 /NCGR_PEP_ID=MMETSP1174-20130828/16518_1 /TAXON_ID=35687 /ORGANISM="Dictyocha speculum, Strain CCMP1381" /LENGTH=33 /DNA_ID= /DNA_START= /DNA_END= /DNA_ORIENTATION=
MRQTSHTIISLPAMLRLNLPVMPLAAKVTASSG